ncbi:hypothetical protein NUACC26_087770 [Scytonema sp. NUACC26]
MQSVLELKLIDILGISMYTQVEITPLNPPLERGEIECSLRKGGN